MRIKTIVGVAFAGAAAAAVVAGGVAYASDDGAGDQRVRIVYEDQRDGAVTGTAVDGRDCPEKSGEAPGTQAPGTQAPGSEAPAETAPEGSL
jgi:hypothetical protein